MRRLGILFLVTGAGLAGAALLVAAAALAALAPQPGDWRVRLGGERWSREVAATTLLRWALHPLARPLLDGRTLAQAGNRWRLRAGADGVLRADCSPCRVRLAALGPQPLWLDRVALEVRPLGADRLDGRLVLGPDQAVVVPWQATLRADGLQLQAALAPTPLAVLLDRLGDGVPEARQARVAGRVALSLRATLGARGLQFERLAPVLDGVDVDGLGSERLLALDPAARCRPQPPGGRIEGWIGPAVIAAEDQRFAEHPGYELAAWVAVARHNQQPEAALQGGSTLTLQLAKLLRTGDERSAARKVREWLHAVEMERTLGKGRILQLYLAVVPWGEGLCGAEAAARHYLGKPANRLKPHEAAWLASLLVNPDLQRRRWAEGDAAARERGAWVLQGMRRLPRERREAELAAWARWRPPDAALPAGGR